MKSAWRMRGARLIPPGAPPTGARPARRSRQKTAAPTAGVARAAMGGAAPRRASPPPRLSRSAALKRGGKYLSWRRRQTKAAGGGRRHHAGEVKCRDVIARKSASRQVGVGGGRGRSVCCNHRIEPGECVRRTRFCFDVLCTLHFCQSLHF